MTANINKNNLTPDEKGLYVGTIPNLPDSLQNNLAQDGLMVSRRLSIVTDDSPPEQVDHGIESSPVPEHGAKAPKRHKKTSHYIGKSADSKIKK